MWRQVTLPVVLVALSWLLVSGTTNIYLQWLDDSYQQVFDENISSMHAASRVQQEIWRLHAELVAGWNRDDDWSERLKAFELETKPSLTTLLQRAASSNERILAQSVARVTDEYRTELQSVLRPEMRRPADGLGARQDRLFSLAVEISEKADSIRSVNDELLRAHDMRRTEISKVVLWARWLAITLVPALGVAIGWWTATRLERSVARIQVSLHDPLLASPGDLGTVHVGRGADLTSIQRQVELVVDRLRQTGLDLQAARQEVLRAERLAAIGGLAAGVAHELRNPLTSVKLLLQHAAAHGEGQIEPPKMGLILDEIERMETTIQGLLEFSRPQKPQRKLHDLRETVERAMHLVAGRAEKQLVQAEVDWPPEALQVNGDPQQLHQVFVNLLINAIEAMPRGGQLRVSLTRDPDEQQVIVEIRDTGEGIPQELLPRLFEPFATAKERGTGLGLAVSRRIVQEHGGSITVRPAIPTGTVFVLHLPAVASSRVQVSYSP